MNTVSYTRTLRKAIPLAIVLVLAGFLFYVLNLYTPLYADDYDYSFSVATGERISSFSQILPSQYTHYFVVNGRFATHTLAQGFLLLGKPFFNIINVFAFLLLGVLIVFHGAGNFRKISAGHLTVVYSMLFLFTPAFGQSYLWLDGSATYLYGVILALLYLVPYRRTLERAVTGTYAPENNLYGFFKFIWMFVLGILAGNTFENMGAALIVIISAYLLFMKLRGIKIRLWMLGLGNIFGLALSVLSPGTQSRMTDAGGLSLGRFFKSLLFIGADYIAYLWIPIFAIICILLLAYMADSKDIPRVRKLFELSASAPASIIYGLGSLAAAFSMALSPQFPTRAWSAPVILLLTALIAAITETEPKVGTLKKQMAFATAALIIISGATWFNAYFEIKSTYVSHLERVSRIETAVRDGSDTVSIPAITSTSPYSVFTISGDLVWDADKWPNIAMAKYFGIDEITRQQGDIHN